MGFLPLLSAHLGPPLTTAAHADVGVERLLQQVFSTAQRAWPQLDVQPDTFFRHLARHLRADEALVTSLDKLHAADFYLASGCAAGDVKAVACFEQQHLGTLDAMLAKRRLDAQAVDEVKQAVRHRLFVGTERAPPKIGHYSGRGPLGAWLRMVAVRLIGQVCKKPAAEVLLGSGIGQLDRPGRDLELSYLGRHYAAEFRVAFAETLGNLSSAERNVLRLYFVEGLTTVVISELLHVHNSTVTRWLQRAREQILQETQRLLADRLNIEGAEFDGLMGLIRSQLDVSISRLLQPTSSDESQPPR